MRNMMRRLTGTGAILVGCAFVAAASTGCGGFSLTIDPRDTVTCLEQDRYEEVCVLEDTFAEECYDEVTIIEECDFFGFNCVETTIVETVCEDIYVQTIEVCSDVYVETIQVCG